MKSLAGSHLRQIDGVLLDDGTATLPGPPGLTIAREFGARARVYVAYVWQVLSPTFEAASRLNPTESGKAIVKAGSTRRFGQLFTENRPQSPAVTSLGA